MNVWTETETTFFLWPSMIIEIKTRKSGVGQSTMVGVPGDAFTIDWPVQPLSAGPRDS